MSDDLKHEALIHHNLRIKTLEVLVRHLAVKIARIEGNTTLNDNELGDRLTQLENCKHAEAEDRDELFARLKALEDTVAMIQRPWMASEPEHAAVDRRTQKAVADMIIVEPATEEELWAAQLIEWPESVRLTPQEVLRWADAPPTLESQLRRYKAIAMALQYPTHVWYMTRDDVSGSTGCRYGMHGSEYLSGFDHL